jgi:3,4-dihydroxy 2-butanone 4-phosphate synthase/GTP cyclohydrolase II
MKAGLASVEAAACELARGNPVIAIDAPDRENEGDLIVAGEKVTPATVNFMSTHARGLICIAMLGSRLRALDIPPMVDHPSDPYGTAFHVSVDHHDLSTTGISASDRAHTIRALSDPASCAADFRRPGHVFPLAYREGGVLRRAGHTEAGVDLAVTAGLHPAAAICEIAGPDGEMARTPALLEMAQRHGLAVVAISDLIAHRRREHRLVRRESEAVLPLAQGPFRAIAYRDLTAGGEHLALVMGDVTGDPPLVRMHSECLTGDALRSRRCDCGAQLERSLELIAEEGRGLVVYLRGHEGRGIGLADKLRAYALQDRGFDTFDANIHIGQPPDRRDYGIGMSILTDLGVRRMRLLTNNPAKRAGLEGYGLEVVERVPLLTKPTAENVAYLRTKQQRMGHALGLPTGATTSRT